MAPKTPQNPLSPEIRVENTSYFGPHPTQSEENVSRGSSPRRNAGSSMWDPGLGIHMTPLPSPSSPGKSYNLSPKKNANVSYTPLSPSEPRPKYLRTPDSATSPGSSFSRTRTDPATQHLIHHRSTKVAEWKIHWRTPTLIFISFLAGVGLSIAQHFLYKFLHHETPPEDYKVRFVLYGRALAYFSKVCFAGCVILCLRQRIWRTLRKQPLSVAAIDRLFLATEDINIFLSWENISKATAVTFMALVVWLIPLATVIFSPGSLSWGTYLERQAYNDFNVPTLNFSAESTKDFRIPITMPNGKTKRSLLFFNTTDRSAKTPGWFDYYDEPSADLTRISLLYAFSLQNQSLDLVDARYQSCGGDWNCTYAIAFTGPGYKCDEQPNDDQKLFELGAPFNTSVLAPVGIMGYMADVDGGDYLRPQTNTTPKGVAENITDDLGVFKTDPKLWLGYSVDTNRSLPTDSPYNDNWTTVYEPHIFSCVHHETKYTVKFNYTGPYVTTNVSYDFLSPTIDTNFTRFANGSVNYDDPTPASNFVSPRNDVGVYKNVAAYFAMGASLRTFLRGRIELEPPKPGPAYARVYSQITSTRLVNAASIPVADFSTALQDFYTDMLLSLFSSQQLVVVANDSTTAEQFVRTRYKQAFLYDPVKLWLCYLPVAVLVFALMVAGLSDIVRDGATFSVGFSRLLVTTRNHTLDEISKGACLGNDPFPPELMATKLKFGVLNEEQDEFGVPYGEGELGVQHCAFGVPSELSNIRKGVPYAGMKHRKRHSRPRKSKRD